ncbi:hypothetical protein [Peribacillus kribbensis]|nr:hypothetical protein [Peribacillus kribbensis]
MNKKQLLKELKQEGKKGKKNVTKFLNHFETKIKKESKYEHI